MFGVGALDTALEWLGKWRKMEGQMKRMASERARLPIWTFGGLAVGSRRFDSIRFDSMVTLQAQAHSLRELEML